MPQSDIDRLRRALEAFYRTGELDSELLDPAFEVHQASSIIDTAGVFKGRDAPGETLRELEEAFEDLSFEPEEFIEAPGGEVVVYIRARGRGRGSGAELDNEIAWVITLHGGKAAKLVVYEERAEALAAVGL